MKTLKKKYKVTFSVIETKINIPSLNWMKTLCPFSEKFWCDDLWKIYKNLFLFTNTDIKTRQNRDNDKKTYKKLKNLLLKIYNLKLVNVQVQALRRLNAEYH